MVYLKMFNNLLEEFKVFLVSHCNFFSTKKKSIKFKDYEINHKFLSKLSEDEYPACLEYIYNKQTGENLNLKNPKTFNEKVQWLKLNDNSPIKSQLTDKILVRDWVKSKIGEEYLKPVLWIGKNFDDIPFEELPDRFIIKTNHGCKWHFAIKDKKRFIETPQVYNFVRNKFNDWMNLCFSWFAGFEMQYKDIDPKILIEPLLWEEGHKSPIDFEIFCFNEAPKLCEVITNTDPRMSTVFNEKGEILDVKFFKKGIYIVQQPHKLLEKAVELSKILCKDFKLVRVDWMVYNDKLYFNEMTFSPQSGFYSFPIPKQNLLLGNMLKIK